MAEVREEVSFSSGSRNDAVVGVVEVLGWNCVAEVLAGRVMTAAWKGVIALWQRGVMPRRLPRAKVRIGLESEVTCILGRVGSGGEDASGSRWTMEKVKKVRQGKVRASGRLCKRTTSFSTSFLHSPLPSCILIGMNCRFN